MPEWPFGKLRTSSIGRRERLRLLFEPSHGGGMVYARDSKSRSRKGLRVQVPPMVPTFNMHDLLDFIIGLCDMLLTPFTGKSDPQHNLMKVVGLIIAALGVLSMIGLLIYLYL